MGGWTFQKLSHLGGVQNFLLEREDKPEKGVDVEMGGCHFFYYFTVQSHLHCMWEKKVSFITFFSLVF